MCLWTLVFWTPSVLQPKWADKCYSSWMHNVHKVPAMHNCKGCPPLSEHNREHDFAIWRSSRFNIYCGLKFSAFWQIFHKVNRSRRDICHKQHLCKLVPLCECASNIIFVICHIYSFKYNVSVKIQKLGYHFNFKDIIGKIVILLDRKCCDLRLFFGWIYRWKVCWCKGFDK